ncbi:type II toxin-antitoxin system RelE/ParE family toxin [Acidisphaera sp. L21]|uniref:type II toxin-antitoxin system RelE/ParE family toxin n=1 Tax=Acidisphaera sp. L21 TaxID=1641851 RepID=UPI00131D2ED4|nr:type II toxin-antitoxin system RelE/ParE family toxin [Acidisphaera sp. L21]
MHAVAETSIFTRRADALLSRDDRTVLISTLATDPEAGDLVPGLGGIRKLRFAPAGRGKSGAFRVIYYLAGVNVPVLALLIYAKNEQDNISAEQRHALLAIINAYKAERRAKKKGTAE